MLQIIAPVVRGGVAYGEFQLDTRTRILSPRCGHGAILFGLATARTRFCAPFAVGAQPVRRL